MVERQKQEQLRENMELMANVKKEMRNFPHLEVIEKIGSGSFGDIFKVWDSRRGIWAALKFEKKDKKNKISLIKKEAQIMHAVKGSQFFARLYDSRFSETSNYSFIEMTFLGPNLESLKKRTAQGRFSLRSVLLIANQMITSLQILHENGIIHRDIKPENFVIGGEQNHHQVFIIDFGLSKYFLEEDGRHIEMKQNKGLVGTARYTSTNSHLGFEQSRRDDLESIAYLLIYFARGSLLWQNLQYKEKEERFKKIAELKATTPIDVMCKGLPDEFLQFLTLVKALGFVDKPDYQKYRDLFSKCYSQSYSTPEQHSCFDWCPKNCSLQGKNQLSRNISGLSSNDIVSLLSSNQRDQIGFPPQSTFKSATKIGQQNNNNNNNATNSQILQANTTTLQSSTGIVEKKHAAFLGNSSVGLNQRFLTNNNNNNASSSSIALNYNNQSMAQNLGQSGVVGNFMNFESIDITGSKQNIDGAQPGMYSIGHGGSGIGFGIDQQRKVNTRNKTVLRELVEKETQDNDDAEETSEEIPVSELVRGENKMIPVFRTENNYAKHQIVASTMLPQQQYTTTAHHQQQTSIQIPKLCLNSVVNIEQTPRGMQQHQIHMQYSQRDLLHIEGANGFTQNNNNNQLSSRYLLPSPRDPMNPATITHIFNKDSSQYVNQDNSNEWNSQQDEKIYVQTIIPSSSSYKKRLLLE